VSQFTNTVTVSEFTETVTSTVTTTATDTQVEGTPSASGIGEPLAAEDLLPSQGGASTLGLPDDDVGPSGSGLLNTSLPFDTAAQDEVNRILNNNNNPTS